MYILHTTTTTDNNNNNKYANEIGSTMVCLLITTKTDYIGDCEQSV